MSSAAAAGGLVAASAGVPATGYPEGTRALTAAAAYHAPHAAGQDLVTLSLADSTETARLAALAAAGNPQQAASAGKAALAQLAPGPAKLHAVERYAAAHGLQVVSADRWQVTLGGPGRRMRRLFGAGRGAAGAAVPRSLASVASAAVGLGSTVSFRPLAVPFGYTGADLRSAYQVTRAGSTGAGATVATV